MSSETFQDKLRRLRREGHDHEPQEEHPEELPGEPEPEPEREPEREPELEPPEARAPGLPVWLRHKLDGRRPGEHAHSELEPARASDGPDVLAGALCSTTSGEPDRLEVHSGEHGTFAARATDFPRDHLHGSWRLEECTAVDPSPFALLTRDAALAGLDLSRAVFLDTETTGLSGGAGVYVYMIGLGWFEGERFRLWQGFLRGPEEERALLAEAARIVGEAAAVVSFFGKSFDRHRLEDKMRIAGIEPPFAERPHLDLYHPFRRLTQGSLVDGRLATVEAALVGLEREDDLPGALAPAAWFDFLAGRAHRLEGVFRHNRDDVLSLVTLAAYLGCALEARRADGEPLAGCAVRRARAIGRAYLDGGDREAALPWFEICLEGALAPGVLEGAVARGTLEGAVAPGADGGALAREVALLRAETLRRLGRTGEARAALEAFTAEDGNEDAYTLPALLALAKLLEHGGRDAQRALIVCERAREVARRVGRVLARDAADLERRLARLRGKA